MANPNMMTDTFSLNFPLIDRVADLPDIYLTIERCPLTVAPDTLVVDVINLLNQSPHDYVLVTEDSKLLSIFTVKDALKIATDLNLHNLIIADVARSPVVTLRESQAETALTPVLIMQHHQIRHLPIVDDTEQLVGIVTETNLVKLLNFIPIDSSEERLRLAMVASNTGIWDWNILSNRVTWSVNVESLFGISPGSFGETYEDFLNWVHPQDRELFTSAIAFSLDTKVEHHAEFRIISPDGNIYWIGGSGKAFFDSKGIATRLIGTVMNITSRKRAEFEFQRMSAALSNALEGISQLDSQGRYIAVNQAYANATGYSTKEMIGMPWEQTVHPEDREKMVAAYQHMLLHGKVEAETRGIRKDGSTFDKQVFMVTARDEQQQLIGHYCFMKDITEKKQLENQCLRVQRLESLGTLASGIAHDLNNILTPILTVAQLFRLTLTNLSERNSQMLDMLENNTLRAADLVKQILSFARGSEGKRTRVQIQHLLGDIKSIVQGTFPKSIEIAEDINQQLMPVCGDYSQLHQMLMNLVVNARDAMPNGGILSISAASKSIDENYARMNIEAKAGNYIVITISDTGVGISPLILDRIFDPFFTTKEVGQGTGLGLSTAIGIIKSHGGFVEVSSNIGQGSQFQVYLPSAEGATTALKEDLELFAGKGELILVVDDEAAIREISKTTLETHNYKVLTASDGIEAIAIYAQRKKEIDLVLMDMMMPSMDGATTIRTLQKINPEVQIVAMSGLTSSEAIAVLSGNGVERFLPKPFTARELLKTLQMIL